MRGRRTSGPQPVSTYDQAKSWLWTYSSPEEWMHDPQVSLPREAVLVCDVFWVSPDKLRADMRKLWDETMFLAAPARSGYRGVVSW